MPNTAPIIHNDVLRPAEFLVNQATFSNQDYAVVATLPNDQFVIIWDSRRTVDDPVHGGLVGRIFNADGTAVTDEFVVGQQEARDQFQASVTSSSDGRFVVSWTSHDGVDNPFNTGSKARIFNADGTPASDDVLVNQSEVGSQLAAEFIELPDGRLLAAWGEFPLPGMNTDIGAVNARIFDSTGQSSGDEFTLKEGPDVWPIMNIGLIGPDKFILSWIVYVQDDQPDFDTKAQIFHLDGSAEGDPFLIHEEDPGFQSPSDVLILADGNIFYTWVGPQARGRLFYPDGTAATGEFLISQEDPAAAAHPKSAQLANGQIAVVWTSYEGGDRYLSNTSVKARLFNTDGTSAGGEFIINSEILGEQRNPEITALQNGQFVVSWHSNDGLEDHDWYGIKARLFNADGSPVDGALRGTDGFMTIEDRPFIIAPSQLLENDVDPDGDALSISTVSATSTLGATLMLNPDGSIIYDPTTSSILDALDSGETLQDSFTYTATDGSLTDMGTVSLNVGGLTDGTADDFAVDDIFSVTADALTSAGATAFRLGSGNDNTGLLGNDYEYSDGIAFVNGTPITPSGWFDGNGGGQFRVFANGAVDFRNQGDALAAGDTTGFSYIANNRWDYDSATVTLTIDDAPTAQDDPFVVSADTLSAAGKSWFRLGAKNDDTDLLENDLSVDEIIFINNEPIAAGVWFDGDSGGQFRVFAGGVMDFRNQGIIVEPGDETGFSYSVFDDDRLLDTAAVNVAFDTFDLV